MRKTPFVFILALSAPLFAQSVQSIPFRAVLLPSNEVPAATADTSATGSATVWIHLVKDSAGNITSGSVDFDADYNFGVAVTITGMHIHQGIAGTAGPVVVSSGLGGTNTIAVPAPGVGSVFEQAPFGGSAPVPVATIQGILANPGGYYLNIHTTDNPAGAMRGQLMPATYSVRMGLLDTSSELTTSPGTPGVGSSAVNSEASGVVSIQVILAKDSSGNPASAQVVFDTNYANFAPGTNFVGMHVHKGAPGVGGPVVISSGLSGPVSAGSGSGNLHYPVDLDTTNPTGLAAAADLVNNPGGYYVNVHTTAFPGGEIRGQLRMTDAETFPLMLMPSNEVPAVTGLTASAPGQISFYTLRNYDGSVAAGTVVFDIDPQFPSSTTFVGMHVHSGAAGSSGPVVIPAQLPGGSQILASGAGNLFSTVTVSSAAGVEALNGLVQIPANYYVNIHTTVNPGGAARSQVAAANTNMPAVASVVSNGAAALTTIAPGEIVTIYGSNLSNYTSDLSGFSGYTSLPQSLNGVTVMFGEVKAPLFYVSPGQINAQVPFEVPAGPQQVTVMTPNGMSGGFSAMVDYWAPSVYAVVRATDYSVISASNPAHPGDVLIAFETGMGQTTPPESTGYVGPPMVASLEIGTGAPGLMPQLFTTAATTATLGGTSVPVLSSVATPGYAGLYQTAFTVPTGMSGTLPLVLTIGQAQSNPVNVVIQ
jgi:uncharacterized protein (TIGR03437 family)